MMLPRVSKEFKAFVALLLLGMLLGNVLIVMISLVVMLFVLFSYMYETPEGMKVARSRPRLTTCVNDEIDVDTVLITGQGVGLITTGDPLPHHFRITRGNNFRVFWKSPAPLTAPMKYRVQCTKRGVYTLGPTDMEAIHFAGMEQTRMSRSDATTELLVQQRSFDLRRMRDPRLRSKIPMPLGSVTKLGALTTDFKELREYQPGDPFRHINWKASVRNSDLDFNSPLVNEYEREGQQVVWIFLDASPSMSVGSSVENAFEHGIRAASCLAQFYLDRNCRVGLKMFNSGRVIIPDTGRRQKVVISKLLLGVEMTRLTGHLREDVRDCRGHLVGSSPLFILITMVRQGNVEEIRKGIREMRMSSGPRAQVMVLHVDGNGLLARTNEEEAGARAADLLSFRMLWSLRATGARVVPWDPSQQSFNELMLKGLRRE